MEYRTPADLNQDDRRLPVFQGTLPDFWVALYTRIQSSTAPEGHSTAVGEDDATTRHRDPVQTVDDDDGGGDDTFYTYV